jgi:hypothetical protein
MKMILSDLSTVKTALNVGFQHLTWQLNRGSGE